jgi:2-polyprenyl-3-methyl-5-hydroxy-6-metoxy-1,4-benzoquinol methylase
MIRASNEEKLMIQIMSTQVNNIITRNGELFVPDLIEDAILKCVLNPLNSVVKAGSDLKDTFSPLDHAVTADYSNSLVVDAYSLYYMRRNIFIPRIALRDITMNSELQKFPEEISVLDIGTGTGAVVIGLLEMFLHPPFNGINIHVDAIDASQACLDRLQCHLDASGLSKFEVKLSVQNVCDVKAIDGFLANSKNYKIIFLANLFNELSHEQSCLLLHSLSAHLTEKGLIVIASAQRDFIKELQPLLVKQAIQDGLGVYYPCPRFDESTHDCWIWREHNYTCKSIRTKQGQFILPAAREQLVATWLILCKEDLSIFDDFRSSQPNWDWGVFRIRGKTSTEKNCEICTENGRKLLPPQKDIITRGAIVGCEGEPPKIQRFINI